MELMGSWYLAVTKIPLPGVLGLFGESEIGLIELWYYHHSYLGCSPSMVLKEPPSGCFSISKTSKYRGSSGLLEFRPL